MPPKKRRGSGVLDAVFLSMSTSTKGDTALRDDCRQMLQRLGGCEVAEPGKATIIVFNKGGKLVMKEAKNSGTPVVTADFLRHCRDAESGVLPSWADVGDFLVEGSAPVPHAMLANNNNNRNAAAAAAAPKAAAKKGSKVGSDDHGDEGAAAPVAPKKKAKKAVPKKNSGTRRARKDNSSDDDGSSSDNDNNDDADGVLAVEMHLREQKRHLAAAQSKKDVPRLIALSGNFEDRSVVEDIITSLGSRFVAKNAPLFGRGSEKPSHLVTGNHFGDSATPKLLLALALGIPVLTQDWVFRSLEAQHWLSINGFFHERYDNKDYERRGDLKAKRNSEMICFEPVRGPEFLRDYTIGLIGHSDAPGDDIIRELAEAVGARVVRGQHHLVDIAIWMPSPKAVKRCSKATARIESQKLQQQQQQQQNQMQNSSNDIDDDDDDDASTTKNSSGRVYYQRRARGRLSKAEAAREDRPLTRREEAELHADRKEMTDTLEEALALVEERGDDVAVVQPEWLFRSIVQCSMADFEEFEVDLDALRSKLILVGWRRRLIRKRKLTAEGQRANRESQRRDKKSQSQQKQSSLLLIPTQRMNEEDADDGGDIGGCDEERKRNSSSHSSFFKSQTSQKNSSLFVASQQSSLKSSLHQHDAYDDDHDDGDGEDEELEELIPAPPGMSPRVSSTSTAAVLTQQLQQAQPSSSLMMMMGSRNNSAAALVPQPAAAAAAETTSTAVAVAGDGATLGAAAVILKPNRGPQSAVKQAQNQWSTQKIRDSDDDEDDDDEDSSSSSNSDSSDFDGGDDSSFEEDEEEDDADADDNDDIFDD